MHPYQVEIDEALAASLLYDSPESTIHNGVIARPFQQQEQVNYWHYGRFCPPPRFVCPYCPGEVFHVHHGVASTSGGFTGHSYGNSSRDWYTHRRDYSDIGSNSGHDHSENLTTEELNIIESVGNVDRGLSESKISRLPTHKYGQKPKFRWWWQKKKKFVADDTRCSICLVDYEKGDKITTLPPCNHIYHKDCIAQWLKKSTICCVCTREVYI
ncbi:E3 ubiquitin-protein ligase Os04g0590900 [Eutrema salsugineum]|uniref:E3 ubiquitin-protein ligase Os04g0590900 n=1 Tax=Eutrema salsugineum TaxID=72664 RepID=UPI000CECFBCE|nr:E3 ubiquitin-protein ligase Os04g0590900 [Eutrema salsugineum]